MRLETLRTTSMSLKTQEDCEFCGKGITLRDPSLIIGGHFCCSPIPFAPALENTCNQLASLSLSTPLQLQLLLPRGLSVLSGYDRPPFQVRYRYLSTSSHSSLRKYP